MYGLKHFQQQVQMLRENTVAKLLCKIQPIINFASFWQLNSANSPDHVSDGDWQKKCAVLLEVCELLPCWGGQSVPQHQHLGGVTNVVLGKSRHRHTGFWGRRLIRQPLEHWWLSCHPALSSQSTHHVFTKEDGTRTAHLERPWENTGKTAFAGLSHFCSWLTDIHYRLKNFPQLSLWAQKYKISTFLPV